VVLRGARVTLRAYREEELDELVRQSAAATGRIGPMPTREKLAQRIAESGRWSGSRLELAVELDGVLVGSVQARAEEYAPPGVCELGVELVPEVRGRGLGTEATGLAARWLLVNGYPRVQASTDVDNVPMRRALERSGFELEGIMRGFMPEGDGRADYALYALVG
jgi:RimJ/RimL family protein N-acetyltransferase